MAKSSNNELHPSINFIGVGTSIKGEISSTGDFRIDGTLNGAISSKGKIVIGQSGTVDGELNCQNADISGEIKARVIVKELLTLKATAKINGDLFTGKLAIEPGAIFTGTCDMSQQANNQMDKAKKPEAVKQKEQLTSG
ncbi:MAG: polymer-forming cytoskeletal protein [Candidatus Moranbacteria bacterium]|nr:polymer-forming cytoskeletal protein [Candidatus Moranbacteria bacterium]